MEEQDILTKYYSVSSIFMFVFKFVFCPHLSLYSIHINICVCVSHRTGVLSFINIVPAIRLGSLWKSPGNESDLNLNLNTN